MGDPPTEQEQEASLDAAHASLRSADDRLPSKLTPQQVSRMLTATATKNARIIHRVLVRLKSLRLFGDDRERAPSYKDPVSVQVLIQLAERYERMMHAELGEDETELQREARLASLLTKIQDAQNQMMNHAHRITEHQTKCAIEAQKIEQAAMKHRDQMDIEREKLAKFVKKATKELTNAELEQFTTGGNGETP
jgi:hypothetical protein